MLLYFDKKTGRLLGEFAHGVPLRQGSDTEIIVLFDYEAPMYSPLSMRYKANGMSSFSADFFENATGYPRVITMTEEYLFENEKKFLEVGKKYEEHRFIFNQDEYIDLGEFEENNDFSKACYDFISKSGKMLLVFTGSNDNNIIKTLGRAEVVMEQTYGIEPDEGLGISIPEYYALKSTLTNVLRRIIAISKDDLRTYIEDDNIALKAREQIDLIATELLVKANDTEYEDAHIVFNQDTIEFKVNGHTIAIEPDGICFYLNNDYNNKILFGINNSGHLTMSHDDCDYTDEIILRDAIELKRGQSSLQIDTDCYIDANGDINLYANNGIYSRLGLYQDVEIEPYKDFILSLKNNGWIKIGKRELYNFLVDTIGRVEINSPKAVSISRRSSDFPERKQSEIGIDINKISINGCDYAGEPNSVVEVKGTTVSVESYNSKIELYAGEYEGPDSSAAELTPYDVSFTTPNFIVYAQEGTVGQYSWNSLETHYGLGDNYFKGNFYFSDTNTNQPSELLYPFQIQYAGWDILVADGTNTLLGNTDGDTNIYGNSTEIRSENDISIDADSAVDIYARGNNLNLKSLTDNINLTATDDINLTAAGSINHKSNTELGSATNPIKANYNGYEIANKDYTGLLTSLDSEIIDTDRNTLVNAINAVLRKLSKDISKQAEKFEKRVSDHEASVADLHEEVKRFLNISADDTSAVDTLNEILAILADGEGDADTSIRALLQKIDDRVKYTDIINNLTTDSTDKVLSAAQGRALNNNKINYSDIVNNLNSTDANKPLSAYQGNLINNKLQNVDGRLSAFENDSRIMAVTHPTIEADFGQYITIEYNLPITGVSFDIESGELILQHN